METKINQLEKCIKDYATHLKGADIFFTPNFDFKRIQNIAQYVYSKIETEYIIACIGTASDTVFVTNQKLVYYNSYKKQREQKVYKKQNEVLIRTIDRIGGVPMELKSCFPTNKIYINGKEFGLTGAGMNKNKSITFLEFLKEIVALQISDIDLANNDIFLKCENISFDYKIVNDLISKSKLDKEERQNKLSEIYDNLKLEKAKNHLAKQVAKNRKAKQLGQLWEFFDENNNMYFSSPIIEGIKKKFKNNKIDPKHKARQITEFLFQHIITIKYSFYITSPN